jgi:hypothetical protein
MELVATVRNPHQSYSPPGTIKPSCTVPCTVTDYTDVTDKSRFHRLVASNQSQGHSHAIPTTSIAFAVRTPPFKRTYISTLIASLRSARIPKTVKVADSQVKAALAFHC